MVDGGHDNYKVVDHVSEEGHTPRHDHDHQLEQGRRQESEERPLEGPHPPVRARDGRIDDSVAVRMAMPVPRWVVGTMVGRMVVHDGDSCAAVSPSRTRMPL